MISLVWAVVVMYLLWRLEIGLRIWIKHTQPLNETQVKSLEKKIDEIQNQVNNLSIQNKDF